MLLHEAKAKLSPTAQDQEDLGRDRMQMRAEVLSAHIYKRRAAVQGSVDVQRDVRALSATHQSPTALALGRVTPRQ